MVEKKNNDTQDFIEQALDKAKPMLARGTFGAVMGYCSGMALRTVGRAVAFTVGMAFIGLQTAASMGFIQVNWDKIQMTFQTSSDANHDGKFDSDDAKAYWRKVKQVLTHKIPDAGGFSLGFLYGARYG